MFERGPSAWPRLANMFAEAVLEILSVEMKVRIYLAIATILSGSCGVTFAQEIVFNRDIRPILSDKCFYCHGPDAETREADLRLDSRSGAEYVFDSGDLVDRITSDDPDLVMPPPYSKLSLTDEEKQKLKSWVAQGAEYQGHWAFELLPSAVAVPSTVDTKWSRQTLDQFVLHRLEVAELVPSGEAAPERWLRRATLDLTGLPPTFDEVRDFRRQVEQRGEEAYEEVVRRLLASQAFGEHMSVAWLDAARYADSYGYQSDKLNTQWPYRDWVVDAFNSNLPYDQFLTWQIAGDLMQASTREQRLATAFNRIHRLNNEGGAVFEEWRIENVADRVHTFGTAVLGLTLECCRCHDHKYDPIPMRDYYALSAFFNSIDESGVYDRTQKVPCPSLLLPTEDQQRTLGLARQTVASAEANYERVVAGARERFFAWSDSNSNELGSGGDTGQRQVDRENSDQHESRNSKTNTTKNSDEAGKDRADVVNGFISAEVDLSDLLLALSFDREFDNSLKQIYHPSQSDRAWTSMPNLVEITECEIPRIDLQIAADLESEHDGLPRRALQLDGERGVTTHGIEPFDRWQPFSVIVTLQETERVAQRSLIAHHTRGTDCGYNGWDLTIVDGHLESRMYRVWPGNAIGVRTTESIPPHQWNQIAATYDGSSKAAGLKLFLNGRELETETLRDELYKSCNVKVDHGGEFVVGQRFRARGFDGGLIDDVRVYSRALTEPELRYLSTGERQLASFEYFVSAVDKATRDARRDLVAARAAFVAAEEVIQEIPVMREQDNPRETHVLARGQYDAPTSDETRVSRDTLSELPLPFPSDAPRDRLGLAKWVTDPSHPLTARVAVNRLWGNFFASPLVRTPENFGSQGELPTHPNLLDWLARDFVDNGWDVKRFCRNVVLSSTYRQDSKASPESLSHDPENRMLARGPAYRLSAEQIRDMALAASGLLNHEVGGPPVSPYQPGQDLWKESNGMSPPYQQSVGQSLYRRSLYSVWKRTAPLPNMMAFDSTTREVCTVKRSRTNTPLQALVLLNDVQFVEAARVLAQRILKSDSAIDPISKAFVRLAGREPDELELDTLRSLFESERRFFAEHPDEAQQLLSMGDASLSGEIPVEELAAMTTVCQAIMNLDATIWKR